MKPTTVITRYRILAVAGAVLGILLAVVPLPGCPSPH